MKVERISYKKIIVRHEVPIYYRCCAFVSDSISTKIVTDKWEIENDIIKKCFFKPRFWQSFSRQFSFKEHFESAIKIMRKHNRNYNIDVLTGDKIPMNLEGVNPLVFAC